MAASIQTRIHTYVYNAVTLVWGLLRLAPTTYIHTSGFHTGFLVGGGGEQDGSGMIVACESTLTHA